MKIKEVGVKLMEKNVHHMDLLNDDFLDVLVRALENDYGRSIHRFAKVKQTGRYSWKMSIIFTDFCLMEGEILIVTPYPGAEPQVEIHGVYY
jgi:hypothetical protein